MDNNTQAQAVKLDLTGLVKPLVWWEPASQNNFTHGARCALGTYYVHVDGGRHQAWLETFDSNREIWCGEVCGSVDSAKAAAQADYTARVLASIDTDAIAELVRCGNVMANALRGNYIVPGSAAAWNAALARLGVTE